MKTTVPQILEEVEKAVGRENKIKVLKAYEHQVLRGILQINYDPRVKVNLPEGEPPFKKDTSIPVGYSESNLYTEFRRFYIWLDAGVNLTKMRKEQLFLQMLEGLHWTESELVCLAKDRKIQTKYKSIKEDLVREAYPDLMPPKVKEVAVVKKDEASLSE
jgi:hypothetical protein